MIMVIVRFVCDPDSAINRVLSHHARSRGKDPYMLRNMWTQADGRPDRSITSG